MPVSLLDNISFSRIHSFDTSELEQGQKFCNIQPQFALEQDVCFVFVRTSVSGWSALHWAVIKLDQTRRKLKISPKQDVVEVFSLPSSEAVQQRQVISSRLMKSFNSEK